MTTNTTQQADRMAAQITAEELDMARRAGLAANETEDVARDARQKAALIGSVISLIAAARSDGMVIALAETKGSLWIDVEWDRATADQHTHLVHALELTGKKFGSGTVKTVIDSRGSAMRVDYFESKR